MNKEGEKSRSGTKVRALLIITNVATLKKESNDPPKKYRKIFKQL